MPIKKVTGGFQWGSHGHVYPTREGAEKQARAAFANGYDGKAEGGEVTTGHMNELERKIIQALIEHELHGESDDLIQSILGHKEEGAESDRHEPDDVPVAEESVEVTPDDDCDDDEDEETKKLVAAYMARGK